jgi:hypothetical protein
MCVRTSLSPAHFFRHPLPHCATRQEMCPQNRARAWAKFPQRHSVHGDVRSKIHNYTSIACRTGASLSGWTASLENFITELDFSLDTFGPDPGLRLRVTWGRWFPRMLLRNDVGCAVSQPSEN